MQVRAFVVVQFLALACVARRHSPEPSGYDGQNWPASLVIDTSNLPDNSAQHDMFYGGGGGSRSTPAFEHEERPETANSDQKVPTTQSSFRPATTQRSPRPEFTPTTHSTHRTSTLPGRTHSFSNQNDGRNFENRRGDERGHSTTPSVQPQFDGYGEQRVQGRQRQGWLPTAENTDSRRKGQFGFRQDSRRPLASNEYDGARTQASHDRQHESHEQEEEDERPTTVSHSRDSSPRRENLPQVEQQNEYESPVSSASNDKQGLLIESVPSGYDKQVHGDFSVDNSGRRPQQNQQTDGYESQASFSSSRDTQTRKPSPINEQQARLVAKLLNIDRMAGYTMGTEDTNSESFERTENATLHDQLPPPSPFLNETETNSTIGEINEILTRPLNASDQPFEDKNLQQATLEIIKLLHDEPQQQIRGQQQSKETMKVGKKVRVIRLPPLSSESDSEEIVLVGERGNATIHRGRNSMFIHASNSQKRRH